VALEHGEDALDGRVGRGGVSKGWEGFGEQGAAEGQGRRAEQVATLHEGSPF